VVSGGTQTDTIRRSLAPLTVRVSDAFGNPVSGVAVAWSKTSGGGALGSATSTTSSDGVASNSYTLGTTPGAEGVSATTAGVTGAATFSFTAIPAAPSAIITVSGGG